MNFENQEQFIGIEIGGTKLQLVTGDTTANITGRVRYTIAAEQGATRIRQQIEEGVEKLTSQHKIRAIGVGFGGPVEWKTGTIQLSHQVEGWQNFNIKEWLQQLTGLPAAVDNDANTAALAEAMHGCGRGYTNLLYLTIGSGIGGGLVTGGKIYHGRAPGEVEIGHVRLDKSGVTLEDKCSGWAVNQRIQQHIETFPFSRLAILSKTITGPGAYLLKPALEENDPDAIGMMNDIADDISFALSHAVHLFNPDLIIIGGGLSLLGEHLRAPISDRLSHYLMKALLPAPPIKIAALGEDAVPVGALELARQLFAEQ